MKYDFNLNKMKGKVQISTEDWLQPDDNTIKICQISGKSSVTCYTRATFVGEGVEDIKKDDIIFVSKVACNVATTPFAQYKIDGKKYFDLPQEQIIGTFQHKISVDTLTLRNKNILFKKIEKRQDSILFIEEKNTMLGKIIAVGKDSTLKTGEIIAVSDNVATPFINDYYVVEEKFVVGICHTNLSIENMEIKNEYVLMKPYIAKGVLNSTVLETAGIDYNYLDYSDINNRNLFRVIYADTSLKNIKPNDLILVDRNYTNYMYYENEKYFIINEKKWISGKIKERDEKCN